MATQLTLNELMTTYGDAATQDRLLQLMNLRTILADCIIDKSYRVSEGLHTPLALTPYGTTVAEQVRKKAAPFYESRLLCLLELIGRDLLIDPIQTNSTFAVMRRRGPRLAGLPGFLRLLLVGGMWGEIGRR